MKLLSSAGACARLLWEVRQPAARSEAQAARRVQQLLVAAMQVPFYRDQMRAAGYDPQRDYRGPQDLAVLRITRKEDVKAAPMAFIQEPFQDRLEGFFSDRTSGSTGAPLAVYRSAPERAVQIAKWMRVLMVNGYRPTQKVLSYTSPGRLTEGRSALQRLGLLRRRAVDYTLPASQCADALLDYRPDVVYGVRTSLLQVAEELARRGTPAPSVSLLVAGGEVIDAATRRLCREAFGREITETYGTVEMGVLACERPGVRGLSLIEDCTWFEFLDERGAPAGPGQLARVVVTDLHGRLMPFIRYEQGDWAVYQLRRNARGETVRVIERIVGRQDDLAPLSNGRMLTYLDFYEVMDTYGGLQRFRVTQRTADDFLVELVADAAYIDSVRAELLQRLQQLAAPSPRFELRRAERIDPEPSGKLRMLVSHVKQRSTQASP